MKERDTHVAVVTDSGCSIRQDNPEAKELEVTVVPLEIKFFENKDYVPYPDTIESEIFYQKMRSGEKLPQTTGALPGNFVETYRKLRNEAESIISIHVTSKRSGVFQSAVNAKNIVQKEDGPETEIEVVDTKLATIGTWFPVKTAAEASKKGATLKDISEEVNKVVNDSQVFFVLEQFDNLKNGGRGEEIIGALFAVTLKLFPVIGFKDGKLKIFATARLKAENARERMIEMLGDAGKLVRLAVVHTNAPGLAVMTREKLIERKIYSGTIPIYEAGPLLGVHAGEGGVGLAFQKA